MDRHRLKEACTEGNYAVVADICRKYPSAVTHKFFLHCHKVGYWLGLDGHGVTCLHLASAYGHKDCCRVLLDCGADVEEKDSDGRTALMYATTFEVVKLLLSRGANVNTRDKLAQTALHYCASAGQDKRCVGELVSAGESVNAVDIYGRTPLQKLIRFFSGRMRELDFGLELVKRGADANTTLNFCGITLLHLCVGKLHGDNDVRLDFQRLVIMGELIQLGANLDARTSGGKTALHFATKSGQKESACKLIKLGANANAVDNDGKTALVYSIEKNHFEVFAELISLGAEANTSTRDGETPLHCAAKKGYSHFVQELVKAGAGMEACDKQGNTPLLFAAKTGHTETVCALADAGAAVDACNRRGETAVHLAAKDRRHTKTVAQLVAYGAPLETLDSAGWTPLSRAIHRGCTETVRELCEAGATLEAKDKDGNTCLHHLVKTYHHELVKFLVNSGADVQALNCDGESALLLAAKLDYTLAAVNLIEVGADVDRQDNDGNTPLSVASKRGNGELCCELLHYGAKVDDTTSFFTCVCNAVKAGDVRLLGRIISIGASINERDKNGSSALHVALTYQSVETAEWIVEHGGDISLASAAGITPLHLAAQLDNARDRLHMTKLLLAKGADPTAVTNRFKTALMIAKGNLGFNVWNILEKAELAHELAKEGGVVGSPDAVAIRFGGPPGAGKSTLTDALQVTRFWGFFRYESQTDEGATNIHQRTKGINCHTFVDENSSRFTIFDLGGHGEFLATHQMFIGDGSVPVIDCVVVSALDENFLDNALKWCSLFASRNQPVAIPWPLLLIATRADTATQQQKKAVISAYRDVERMFSKHFRFPCRKPLFIDARKSWNELTIELRQVLNQLHQELTDDADSQQKPAICRIIEDSLPELRQTTPSPVILKEHFIKFMLPRIRLRGETEVEVTPAIVSLFDKALKYLSGYATVLSFGQLLVQRYVILNPQWLLSDIVGRLMAEPPLPEPHVHYDNGYAKTSDVVAALETEHLPGREALEMVAGLGFCLEQKSANTVLNPSKLREHRLEKHWRRTAVMVVNAGRRLKCKGTVAIASAFFSHLQVHFYHRYLSDFDERLPMWTGGIRLVAGQCSSVEAIIESDPSNSSIDIIVRGREGSETDCSDLLHSLTEETLQKATEISPGSQLRLFFLSKLELDELSPAGFLSRPLVEYSEERVLRAISRGKCVSDGSASTPEYPVDLLLPRHFQQRSELHTSRRAKSGAY